MGGGGRGEKMEKVEKMGVGGGWRRRKGLGEGIGTLKGKKSWGEEGFRKKNFPVMNILQT